MSHLKLFKCVSKPRFEIWTIEKCPKLNFSTFYFLALVQCKTNFGVTSIPPMILPEGPEVGLTTGWLMREYPHPQSDVAFGRPEIPS